MALSNVVEDRRVEAAANVAGSGVLDRLVDVSTCRLQIVTFVIGTTMAVTTATAHRLQKAMRVSLYSLRSC